MGIWVPVAGSSLVAVASLITLFFTVRQNSKSLAEASRQHAESLAELENREWRQWRRELLTEHCNDILDIGQKVIGASRGSVYWSTSNSIANFIEQSNSASELTNIFRKIELVVGGAIDSLESELFIAISSVLEGVSEEIRLKTNSSYDPTQGLARLEPACAEATERLRALTAATRKLLGDNSVS